MEMIFDFLLATDRTACVPSLWSINYPHFYPYLSFFGALRLVFPFGSIHPSLEPNEHYEKNNNRNAKCEREREIRCNKLYARLFVFRLFEVYYYKKDIDYSASWLGGWLLFVFIVALFPKLMLNGPISHVRMCDTGFGVHYKIDKSVSDWKFAWLFLSIRI